MVHIKLMKCALTTTLSSLKLIFRGRNFIAVSTHFRLSLSLKLFKTFVESFYARENQSKFDETFSFFSRICFINKHRRFSAQPRNGSNELFTNLLFTDRICKINFVFHDKIVYFSSRILLNFHCCQQ